MQKRAVVVIGCLALLYFATAGEPGADQKWIVAVEKIVMNGETKVSTPDAVRVDLLKQWAVKKGYTAKVTKTDAGYSVELIGAKRTAQNQ